MYTKQDARTLAKIARLALPPEIVQKNSQQIFQKLQAMAIYQHCHTILCYADSNGEVATGAWIEACLKDGKRIALPKVERKRFMRFYYIESLSELQEGAYHILEPTGFECCIPDSDTIIILPGVAFDKECHRVGYGGGYYDTYLESYPNLIKIGVCHEVQLFPSIQTELFDICPDILITEKQIIYKNTCI